MPGDGATLVKVDEAAQQGVEADEAWSTSELRSLTPVFGGLMNVAHLSPRSMARLLACVVLVVELPGCGRCTDNMVLHHVEGLLPGYSELKCILYDYDSTVIAFSYTLPEGMTPQRAFDLFETSVSRSMWKEGVTPPESCYRVVARRENYLLMVCEEPGLGPTSAWEFRLEGRSLRVTTGPGRDVLRFIDHELVGASP